MNRGLLIYNEIDCEKNKLYIEWLINEGKKYNFNIEFAKVNNNTIITHKDVKFVINRSRFFRISKDFEEQGVRVFNNSVFCKLGNDKLKGYEFAQELEIRFPRLYNENEFTEKIIVKPRDGHGGEGVELLNKMPLEINSNMIYQEYIKEYIGDVRFYIINNKVVHSVLRTPAKGNIISNFTKGGEVEIFHPNNEQMKIVDKILNKIDIDYGGIDFLLLKNGEILFNEFEDAVGSRMLSHLGINNTTELFLNHIREEVEGIK